MADDSDLHPDDGGDGSPHADGGTAGTPAARPLDLDALRRALFALATGDVDGAVAVIEGCDALEERVRAHLTAALLSTPEPGDRARALGDRLREGFDRDLVNEAYRAAFYLGGHGERLAENPLYAWFLAHRSGSPVDKWVHYFPAYHRHLERFRGRAVRVLEIGVYRGGGLAMWQHYFGPDARIVGLDVDEAARRAAGDSFVVELGDQADPEVLRRVERAHGPFDVVVDDGGHRMDQQRASVETLFPLLKEDGVLVVEDAHTSYWPEYGGGRERPDTFLAWVRDRIDDLHAFHLPSPGGDVGGPGDASADAGGGPARVEEDVWATHLDGIHVYDSLVVLEKAARFRPFSEVSGTSAYLRTDRPGEAALIDLVSARDAARSRLEELEVEIARLHAAGVGQGAVPGVVPPADDELRRLQAALRWSQGQLADVGRRVESLEKELASTNGRLLESWEQIRLMRKSVSWRVTAPIRAVRGLGR